MEQAQKGGTDEYRCCNEWKYRWEDLGGTPEECAEKLLSHRWHADPETGIVLGLSTWGGSAVATGYSGLGLLIKPAEYSARLFSLSIQYDLCWETFCADWDDAKCEVYDSNWTGWNTLRWYCDKPYQDIYHTSNEPFDADFGETNPQPSGHETYDWKWGCCPKE